VLRGSTPGPRSDDFRQVAATQTPQAVHLPEPVLGRDISLHEKCILQRGRANVGNARWSRSLVTPLAGGRRDGTSGPRQPRGTQTNKRRSAQAIMMIAIAMFMYFRYDSCGNQIKVRGFERRRRLPLRFAQP
jgi:hypothetical protein